MEAAMEPIPQKPPKGLKQAKRKPSVKKKKASKDTSLNIRVNTHERALLDKAAEYSGSDRSSLILDAAIKKAENILLDRRDFFLDEQDFDKFEKILSSKPRTIKELKALFKDKAPWEK